MNDEIWQSQKVHEWTEEEKAEVRSLHEAGASTKVIGDKFGVTDSAIRHLLGRMREAEGLREDGREPPTMMDRLRALHDAFDAKAPGRRTSRPRWIDVNKS